MSTERMPEFQKILLAVEFSDLSRPAEIAAFSLARKLGGSIDVLHVIEPLDALAGDPAVEGFYQKLEKRATEALNALVGRNEGQEVPINWEVVIGHRASVIVRRAEELESDLIVMGSRGLEDGVPITAISSTSHRVAFHAPCPIMLVGRHSLRRENAALG